jgi:hypothetical protein
MKQLLTLAALCGALTCAAFASSPKAAMPAAKKDAKSAVVKCPKCKMPLVAKADKTHTAAVKINGKTMYCCAACGAHKAAAKDAKKTAAKGASSVKCAKCGMMMKSAPSGPMYSTPMKANGKTYYCCPGCQKA